MYIIQKQQLMLNIFSGMADQNLAADGIVVILKWVMVVNCITMLLGIGRRRARVLQVKVVRNMQRVERVLSLAPKALFSPHLYDPAYQSKSNVP